MTELEEFRLFCEDFTAGLLRAYTKRLQTRLPAGAPRLKEFSDPVWQTIVLQPFEVVVLDSPLMQRLRRIKQLGVAHWVYPGATHSRFEHSVGTLQQMQNLVTAINSRSGLSDQPITPDLANLLRLTALCHDVGHGFMSHVSEKAVLSFPEVENLQLQFADATEMEEVKPSEIAAYYILGSGSFKLFIGTVMHYIRNHPLPDAPEEMMKTAIIGKPLIDRIPLLHELISGPFDADKLDYMPRDARMAGTPVVTDIPRLVQKVRAVAISATALPPEVARSVRGNLPSYWITGIALSGGRTLDELMVGRSLLLDKIYRHQRVRSAEAMVAAMIAVLLKLLHWSPAQLPYRLVDEDLLSLNAAACRTPRRKGPR